MVSVAERAAPGLTETEIVVVPLPLPEAPPVIVTKASLLTAVQLQLAADADTVTVVVPPAADIDIAFRDTESVQPEVGTEGDVVGCVGEAVVVQAADSAARPTRMPRDL
jgi:hypothetical protein